MWRKVEEVFFGNWLQIRYFWKIFIFNIGWNLRAGIWLPEEIQRNLFSFFVLLTCGSFSVDIHNVVSELMKIFFYSLKKLMRTLLVTHDFIVVHCL